MDLSRPQHDSVNDYISQEDYSLTFCSIDDATRLLSIAGKGALMGKEDVKAAFRLIPVRPEDWSLLGFQVNGQFYFDVVLPFGGRSSPFLFCLFSGAIHWILENETGCNSILHYCDDYLVVGKPSTTECADVIAAMREICLELGVPLATEKACGPSTTLEFLGIELDSNAQTLSLSAVKLADIMAELDSWKSVTSTTRTKLQSLIGKLQFVAKCVPSGRLFTRRMINLLRGPLSDRHKKIHLDADFHLDLAWWSYFLPRWNGQASFLDVNWSCSTVLDLYTDASATLGCGAIFGAHWFQCSWPQGFLDFHPSIEYLEMVPILLALLVWGKSFYRKRLVMHCDNLGAVQAWAALGSTSRSVLDLMRRISSLAAEHNFTVVLKHIHGVDNSVADSLSRFQVHRFRQLAPGADDHPTEVPNIFSELIQSYWECHGPYSGEPRSSS
jgi:hypothetical protein